MLIVLSNFKSKSIFIYITSASLDRTSDAVLHMTDQLVGMFV